MTAAAVTAAPRTLEKGRSLLQDAWARFFKNRFAVACGIVLITIIAACYIGPNFTANPDRQYLAERKLPPGSERTIPAADGRGEAEKGTFILGSDDLGRDLFARLLAGGRVSLNVAIIATLVAIVIGLVYGAIAGFVGGRIDSLMMRIVDILLGLPFILFVILIRVALDGQGWLQSFGVWLNYLGRGEYSGPGMDPGWGIDVNMLVLYAAIGAVEWPTMARIVRSQVQSLRKMEFVEAATSLGLSRRRIIFRHVVPNVIGPVIVYATLIIPSVMLLEAALSYLGLGVQAPQASWGSLIEDGVKSMEVAWWLLWIPASVFFLTLFCFNFVGDGLRDAFDVKAAKD